MRPASLDLPTGLAGTAAQELLLQRYLLFMDLRDPASFELSELPES